MSTSPRKSESSEDNAKYAEKSPRVLESVIPANHDADAQKLVEMGYQPQLRRNFSIWAVLGVGFSVTNSWWGISAGLIAGVNSGGPVLIIYGIILIATISTGVGISLAELASAMPNSGGQYYWTGQLAPRRYAPFLSFLTGAVGWAGAVFTSASVCLSLGSSLVGMYALGHPDLVIQPWMVFVTYQLVNIFAFVLNCSGRLLPKISAASLYVSLLSCFVITIAVPAASKTKQSAKFVFATFVNETGWENNVIAFIVGLINPNWSFACLDVATHMAEEIHNPERMIPLSILATVGIGLVSALGYSIAIFFSMSDLAGISSTTTGVPILALYQQATRSVAGAIILQVLVVLTGIGCLTACHTWQARLAWSFARDRGMPGSRYWSVVHPKLDVPLNAHVMSSTWVAVLGCLYIASTTAFNSMVTGCLVFLYISYAIPVSCLLARGRNSIKHGPFWLSGVGLFSNIVLLGWTLFTLVFYNFPFVKPVEAGNMNYVCAVIGIYAIYLFSYWAIRGRRTFRVHEKSAEAIKEGSL
ncbi:amino acid transporter [Ceratobasidium sp. AG-I]|nr:amino acid transporter [Ceratobasidium sp. AG-I]